MLSVCHKAGAWLITCAGFTWLAACASATPEWRDEGQYRWRDLAPSRSRSAVFSVVPPAQTGVTFANSPLRDSVLANKVLAMGGGVALGDYDGDSHVDVALVGARGSSTLYRNLGDWEFKDVTAETGLTGMRKSDKTAVAFADLNGDGLLDLLVADVAEPIAAYINDGRGRFDEKAAEIGLGGARGGSSITLADVDGNGSLDLYVSNYRSRYVFDLLPPQEIAFQKTVTGDGRSMRLLPQFRSFFRLVIDTVHHRIVRRELGDPDWFFLNDGKGRFARQSFAGGRFTDESGRVLRDSQPHHFGLGAAFHDFTNDGAPDLYVTADFDNPDGIWINDGRGGFRAASSWDIRKTSLTSMGVAFSDVDRDGLTDIFVADMLSADPVRRKQQVPSGTPFESLPGVFHERQQVPHNTLLKQRTDGSMVDVAFASGVAASEWAWSPMFLDVDLDGDEDLLVTNGYEWDALSADMAERLQTRVVAKDWRSEAHSFPPLNTRNLAFRNNGDGTFQDIGSSWGFGREEDVAHGMASGDLDGDGYLDLVINRWRRPAEILRNRGGGSRVVVALRGRAPNTQAVGATIEVTGSARGTQRKQVMVGDGYRSSSELRYTFAADATDSLTITVRWRSGARTTIAARANRSYEIREPVASPPTPDVDRHRTSRRESPLFDDVSTVVAYRHRAPVRTSDFHIQPLLPYSLTRMGFGIGWTDLDGDRVDELVLPGGTSQELFVFRRQRGAFVRSTLARSRTATFTDSVHVGGLPASDVEGDGVLDRFVPGYRLPGRYPLTTPPHLLRGEAEDTSVRVLLAGLGPIAAAVFTDLDDDGRADLVVAPEWGAIQLLRNDGTRFVRLPGNIDSMTGWWNGLASGDLNADGRPDLVVTSWGRNTPRRAAPTLPLYLYYGDFERDNRISVVLAQYDSVTGVVAPTGSLPQLSAGLRTLRRRIRTFESFARASIDDVLGPAVSRARRFEARTLDHTVLLSTPTAGRFLIGSLPTEAQLSPAFFAGIADFDGDGHQDVVLTQNFFGTEPGGERHDGGLSMLLRGDGRGGLAPMPAETSGIRVYGEGRGAGIGDYDADGRLDIAIAQYGAELKLYHNVRAKPGLRVLLTGPAGNPLALGARVRPILGGQFGAMMEVQHGSGYWSINSPTLVVGREGLTAVEIRWPGGSVRRVPVSAADTALFVRHDSAASPR